MSRDANKVSESLAREEVEIRAKISLKQDELEALRERLTEIRHQRAGIKVGLDHVPAESTKEADK
jgi:predicted DNA-binding protein (UPF0251 family)